MEPLQAVAMPSHAVIVGLTTANTWRSGTNSSPVYLAYVATNSTQTASFVSLHSAAAGAEVLSIASRRSYSPDYQYGVVLELRLAEHMADMQTVHLTLAQCGATTYYPPQPIQD